MMLKDAEWSANESVLFNWLARFWTAGRRAPRAL